MFISLAEKTGLIVPMGTWVLEEVSRQTAEWEALSEGKLQITLSVNVSVRQLEDNNFLNILKNTRDKFQLKSTALKLELIETALVEKPDLVNHVLNEVQKLGIKTALDDFGTGYCSLSYLHRFPINTLKIDQAFVSQIETNSMNRTIVRSTIELAHNLGMDVVAEGVSTEEEVKLLDNMGCDYGQGYLFNRPLSAEDAGRLFLSENGGG